MILLNLGSKQAATVFPTGKLHDFLFLLQDPLFYHRKQAESLGSGIEGAMKHGKCIDCENKAWMGQTLSRAQSNALRWLDFLNGNDNFFL